VTATRSALIVATSKYRDSRLATLDGPGEDAEALRSVLANKEIGGFDVRVALNSRVDTLRRTLEGFFADRARDDLLLVHFSGHGLKDDDGQLYLAAADTQLDRLLSTGIDAAWVNRLMNKCRSERIALFLDCCFAGAFTTAMTRRVGADTAGVKEQFTGSGLFVITASDAMQYSFEGGRQVGQPPEPSPFTKALVDGLRSGEADRDEDGHVSINELFDYLEDRIRETSPFQTPTKSAFNQVGDWVIAQSTRMPSVRLLPAAVQVQLKSENPLDRIGALFDLRDLIEGPDKRLADAATQALQRLAQDDSRTVAARAQQILDETARPRSVATAARRRAMSIAPNAVRPEPEQVTRAVAADVDLATPRVRAEAESILAPAEPASVAPSARADITQRKALHSPPFAAQSQGASGLVTAQSGIQAPAARIHPELSADASWSLRRAASRALIGSIAWSALQFVWLVTSYYVFHVDLTISGSAYLESIVASVFYTTVIVAIGEKVVPALRVPRGAAYRRVQGNRWHASAILGAGAGLTVGLAVQATYGYLGFEVPFCAALGFVVAEAIVGRRFGGDREAPSVAA